MVCHNMRLFIAQQRQTDNELPKNTPYLTITCELRSTFCEYLRENKYDHAKKRLSYTIILIKTETFGNDQ